MEKAAGTLELAPPVMNLHATQADVHSPLRGGPLKFALASGSRPLDGYTIKRGVGRGGFGEVYYAVSDAGKEVALKLIRRNLDVELRGVSHCLNLKHPNLLSLYDVRQDDQENSWVIMEYMSGESLDQLIDRHQNGMPVDEVVEWMHGICSGVAYLHDHGIVHRDLKPGNIFIDEGIVKLGDYGLAKFISCSRRSGQTESVGTVHYMAPEVANGRYGKEIDLYALGVILYEMLTGHVPFEGESVGEVLMKHLTAEPDLTKLAEPYRQIVAKLLAKDSSVRYASVEALMADLPASSRRAHFSYAKPPEAAESRAYAEPPQAPTTDPAYPFTGPWLHPCSPEAAMRRVAAKRAAREEYLRLRNAQARGPGAAYPTENAAAAGITHDEEPIAKFFRDTLAKLGVHVGKLSNGSKVLLFLAGIYVLSILANGGVAWRGVIYLFFAYGIYRLIRKATLKRAVREDQRRGGQGAAAQAPPPPPMAANANYGKPGNRPANAHAVALSNSQQRAELEKRSWKRRTTLVLPTKPWTEQLADLLGSMLMSAGVIAALSVVMLLVRGREPELPQYMWLTLTAVAGCWAVLIPGKLWEGGQGETSRRRFVMLLIGLGVGCLAYGLNQALLVELPHDLNMQPIDERWASSAFYNVDGSPRIYLHLVYFGFLFLTVRWWRQADPLRPVRLSLWSATCCVFAAFILNLLWKFPQPWGFMVAAAISIATQLTSTWISPDERRQLQDTGAAHGN